MTFIQGVGAKTRLNKLPHYLQLRTTSLHPSTNHKRLMQSILTIVANIAMLSVYFTEYDKLILICGVNEALQCFV